MPASFDLSSLSSQDLLNLAMIRRVSQMQDMASGEFAVGSISCCSQSAIVGVGNHEIRGKEKQGQEFYQNPEV